MKDWDGGGRSFVFWAKIYSVETLYIQRERFRKVKKAKSECVFSIQKPIASQELYAPLSLSHVSRRPFTAETPRFRSQSSFLCSPRRWSIKWSNGPLPILWRDFFCGFLVAIKPCAKRGNVPPSQDRDDERVEAMAIPHLIYSVGSPRPPCRRYFTNLS
jgi:hypothetical protein